MEVAPLIGNRSSKPRVRRSLSLAESRRVEDGLEDNTLPHQVRHPSPHERKSPHKVECLTTRACAPEPGHAPAPLGGASRGGRATGLPAQCWSTVGCLLYANDGVTQLVLKLGFPTGPRPNDQPNRARPSDLQAASRRPRTPIAIAPAVRAPSYNDGVTAVRPPMPVVPKNAARQGTTREHTCCLVASRGTDSSESNLSARG